MFAGQDLAVDLIGCCGCGTKHAGGIAGLEHAFTDPRAALGDQYLLNFLGTRLEYVTRLVQYPGPLRMVHPGPLRMGCFGSRYRRAGVVPGSICDLAKDIAGRRVEDIEPGTAGRVGPLSIDVKLVIGAGHCRFLTYSSEKLWFSRCLRPVV